MQTTQQGGQAVPLLDPAEQHHDLTGPGGRRLFLRFMPGRVEDGHRQAPCRTVLYVHGATFPSALSIAHRFDGRSWRDALCAAGFDVWALDFSGFGHSERFPEMDEPADANPPLGLASDATEQLAAAVRFVLDRQGRTTLSLIAHSWGCIVAGRFAAAHPGQVDRILMFGPICRRDPPPGATRPQAPAWQTVSLDDQWTRFVDDVPAGEPAVLSRRHFEDWGQRYLDSDPPSRTRDPPAVRIPTGPTVEIRRAWHGDYPYDPAGVRAPVAIVRGAWDSLVTADDARWLRAALRAAPSVRDIEIPRATHLMHLESGRFDLWRESIDVLMDEDVAIPAGDASQTTS